MSLYLLMVTLSTIYVQMKLNYEILKLHIDHGHASRRFHTSTAVVMRTLSNFTT